MEKTIAPARHVAASVRIRRSLFRGKPSSPLASPKRALLLLGALLAAVVLGCGEKEPQVSGPAKPGELPKVEVWQPGKKLGPEGVPWDPKPLGKQQVLNRMRLQAQKGLWEPLERLSSMAIQYDDKDLIAYGHWFRAVLAGRSGKADEALAHLQTAVKFGFKNADEIASNENLKLLAEREDFVQFVEGLRTQLERDLHEYFEKLVDSTLEAAEAAVPWNPRVVSSDSEPFFPQGTPTIVVLARTNHDGVPKTLDVLRDAMAKSLAASRVETRLVFYEYDPGAGGDPSKAVERAAEYVRALAKTHAVPQRWGVIGHEDFLSLREAVSRRDRAVREKEPSPLPPIEVPRPTFNCFPQTVFLDAACVPVLALESVPEPWEMEYALGRYAEKVAAPGAQEAPPPEAPPKESAESG